MPKLARIAERLVDRLSVLMLHTANGAEFQRASTRTLRLQMQLLARFARWSLRHIVRERIATIVVRQSARVVKVPVDLLTAALQETADRFVDRNAGDLGTDQRRLGKDELGGAGGDC